MSTQPSTPAQNPVALLQESVLRLADIYQAQQEQINLLRLQNERLTEMLQALVERSFIRERPIGARLKTSGCRSGQCFLSSSNSSRLFFWYPLSGASFSYAWSQSWSQ